MCYDKKSLFRQCVKTKEIKSSCLIYNTVIIINLISFMHGNNRPRITRRFLFAFLCVDHFHTIYSFCAYPWCPQNHQG